MRTHSIGDDENVERGHGGGVGASVCFKELVFRFVRIFMNIDKFRKHDRNQCTLVNSMLTQQ